jgi:DNA transformation protein and related proteins
MPVTPSYQSYLVDQLTALGEVSARRMFGGVGLYYDGTFFGLIDDDVLFLRVDDESRGEYLARAMPAFHPVRNKPELSTPSYYQVPGDVLDDAEQLVEWARRALAAARAAPPRRKRVRAKRTARS